MASTYNKKQLAELTAFAKGEESQSCKAEKLNGAGFRFEDFRKSHEDCNADNFAVCREAVIAGMPAAKRNLLVTPSSELPVHMRPARREAQMAVGAYMGRAYKMLKKLQTEAAGEGEGETELDKIKQLLAGLLRRAGKDNSGVPKAVIEKLNQAAKAFG